MDKLARKKRHFIFLLLDFKIPLFPLPASAPLCDISAAVRHQWIIFYSPTPRLYMLELWFLVTFHYLSNYNIVVFWRFFLLILIFVVYVIFVLFILHLGWGWFFSLLTFRLRKSRSMWKNISQDRINKFSTKLGYLCLRSSMLETYLFL